MRFSLQYVHKGRVHGYISIAWMRMHSAMWYIGRGNPISRWNVKYANDVCSRSMFICTHHMYILRIVRSIDDNYDLSGIYVFVYVVFDLGIMCVEEDCEYTLVLQMEFWQTPELHV